MPQKVQKHISADSPYSVSFAQSIGEVCLRLSHAAHDAGLYRMSFLLHEVVREAEFAVDMQLSTQHPPSRPAIPS